MLQIAVALLYFINKVLLSLQKKAGWQIGMLASITAIFYFIQIKMYLFLGLEIGFLAVQAFGWLHHNKPIKNEWLLHIILSISLLGLFFTLKNTSWLEFLTASLFQMAIYFLAKHRWTRGWAMMLVGHVLMAYFIYQKGQFFFSTMQILSCVVAIFALSKKRNSN
jgi:Nicotinamide mononucleotide transporter